MELSNKKMQMFRTADMEIETNNLEQATIILISNKIRRI